MGHGEYYSGNDCVEPVAQVAHFIAFCSTTSSGGGGGIVSISGIEARKVGGDVEVRGAIGCQ
jgi:hypothetical protein